MATMVSTITSSTDSTSMMRFAIVDNYFTEAQSAPKADHVHSRPVAVVKNSFGKSKSELNSIEDEQEQYRQVKFLEYECQRINKDLRTLYKLRNKEKMEFSSKISKFYQRMHIREAQLATQYGKTKIAIINWRIVYEEKYLSYLKELIETIENQGKHRETFDARKFAPHNGPIAQIAHMEQTGHLPSPRHVAQAVPSPRVRDLHQMTPHTRPNIVLNEAPEKHINPRKTGSDGMVCNAEEIGVNEATIGLLDTKACNHDYDAFVRNGDVKNIEMKHDASVGLTPGLAYEESGTKFADGGIAYDLSQNPDYSANCLNPSLQSFNNMSKFNSKGGSLLENKSFVISGDLKEMLSNFRHELEKSMQGEKKRLKDLCYHLQREVKNENFKLERQEELISYDERLAVVILLFHWFVETHKYRFRYNLNDGSIMNTGISADSNHLKRRKKHFLCHTVLMEIQFQFDALALDSRNKTGRALRKWFDLLGSRDIRQLKADVLLRHINSFILNFIKNYHYIIVDIVSKQQSKYNIDEVLAQVSQHSQFRHMLTPNMFKPIPGATNSKYATSRRNNNNNNNNNDAANAQDEDNILITPKTNQFSNLNPGLSTRHSVRKDDAKSWKRKNKNKNRFKNKKRRHTLTCCALRHTCLRMLQRTIFARLDSLDILPPRVDFKLKLKPALTDKTDVFENKKDANTTNASNASNAPSHGILPSKSKKAHYPNNSSHTNNMSNNSHESGLASKLKKKSKVVAMVSLGKSSLDETICNSESDDASLDGSDNGRLRSKRRALSDSKAPAGSLQDQASMLLVSERKESIAESNANTVISYTDLLPSKHHADSIVLNPNQNQNPHQSKRNANDLTYEELPSFDLYKVPRNKNSDFETLDAYFYKQCEWMKHLSPSQLGIEEAYWCDAPPQESHASSELNINNTRRQQASEEANNITNLKQYSSVLLTGAPQDLFSSAHKNGLDPMDALDALDAHDGQAAMPVSSLGAIKWLGADTQGGMKVANWDDEFRASDRSKNKKQAYLARTPVASRGDFSGNYAEHRDVRNDGNRAQKVRKDRKDRMKRSGRSGRRRKMRSRDDYRKKPYGDALRVMEYLDELWAPIDLNECLANVVSAIFRIAGVYRKHNIMKQNIISRVELSARGFGGNVDDVQKHRSIHLSSPQFGPMSGAYPNHAGGAVGNLGNLGNLSNVGSVVNLGNTASNVEVRSNVGNVSHLSYLSNNSTYNTNGKRGRAHTHAGGLKSGKSSILSGGLHRSLNALQNTLSGKNNNLMDDNESVASTGSSSSLMSEPAIGADVFFPIFIWVLIHCRIENVHRIVYVMSHYNDSDAMKTECGYNVSTLHSALDHIMRANPKLYIQKKFSKK